MTKTVAITGVNSYFAATLLPRLEADPDVGTIIGIDINPAAPRLNAFTKLRFCREDIRSENLAACLTNADTVYHMAFIVCEIRDKKKTRDININGTRNVLAACRTAKVRKLIYTSSATVYGSHPDTPVGLTENCPLCKNPGSYYNSSKIEGEQMLARFAEENPDLVVTVLRAGLLLGPQADNMFTRLFALPISALPMGSLAHNQYIHEDDLAEALYLAFAKDLPGFYNVAADDAMAIRKAYRRAGVAILRVPFWLLRPLATMGFYIGLFPAGGGWVSLCRHTIFMNCDKFKTAAGWGPRYTSEQTFEGFLEARGKIKEI